MDGCGRINRLEKCTRYISGTLRAATNRHILISLLGVVGRSGPVSRCSCLLPSGFLGGSAGHTASLRRSLGCLEAQGA